MTKRYCNIEHLRKFRKIWEVYSVSDNEEKFQTQVFPLDAAVAECDCMAFLEGTSNKVVFSFL